nr:hypothetical protein [Tanacetum cinerariifolium]
MIAILEKTKHNIDFHQIVDFLKDSHIRYALTISPTVYVSHIRQFWSTARIETKNEETKILATVDGKPRTISESSLRRHLKLNDEEGISSLPDTELFENLSLMGYNILQNQRFTFQKGQFSHQWKFFMHTIMQCLSPKSTSFNEFSSNIATVVSKALSPATDEPASLLRDDSQGEEEVRVERSNELGSNDTEEIVNVLSSMEAANILTSRSAAVSASPVATATIVGVSTVGVPTISGLFPTVSVIFTTASVVIPYSRQPREISRKDKGKEKVVESEVPKKRKLQEHIDAQVAREIEEEFARDNQRLSKQLAKDSDIARLHAEEELKMMIEGLDRSNEMIAKHLQDYEQAAANLSIVEKIELSKPLSKKEQRDFYMLVLRSHARCKTRHFRGMTLEEIKEKFILVWKQIEDFVSMSSKEEGERIKRKGIKLDQGSAKMIKTFEDVSEEDLKGMTQLVPLEEVYVKALQVKHPIIDWEIHSEGQREEELHQLWILVKETLNIKHDIKDKEKEFWVELKRLFELDFEDQLWTHNQAFIHDPLEWKLYDTCGVHHVFTKDQEIFMLVEKDYPLRKGLATMIICNKLQFWTSVAIKKVNDVTRLQALVDKKKVVITEVSIRDTLRLDDAKGVEYFPNEEIFAEYIFDSLVRNVDSPIKFYMYPRFLQLMIRKQVGDLLTHTTKYTSLALTQKVFANMRWVGKGFSGVETPLFEGMTVEQQVAEGADKVHDEGVPTTGIIAEGDVSATNDEVPTAIEEPSIPSPTPPTPPPQPSQDIPSTSQDAGLPMDLLQNLMDTFTTLSTRGEHLEQDKVAQALEITKLKSRVKKLEKRNKASKLKRLKKVGSAQRLNTFDDTVMDDVSKQGGIITNIDADEDVVLEDAKEIVADAKDSQDADIDENADVQGRTEEFQAQLEHANKVLSMQDEEESELAELQEVVDVVTTTKIITEVVSAASDTITAASTTITTPDVPIPAATTAAAPTLIAAPSRRTKGVVIKDPEESTATSTIIHSKVKSNEKGKGILVEEPKSLKKQA